MGTLKDNFDNLGCWNIITCINSDNLDLIEQGINDILEPEGYRRISKPPLPQKPKPLLEKLLSSPWQMKGLLVIGLSLGNLGWTIVKTSSSELFCRRAKNAVRPRLSELAKKIGCNAFAYKVHDIYLGALLEVDTSDKIFVSGYLDNSNSMGDYDVFCHEPINKLAGGLNFHLLHVSKELKAISEVKDIKKEERKKREEKLEKFVEKHPEQIKHALSEYKKIHQSAFVRDNENLCYLLYDSNSFWHENNLLYKAYAQPEQLAKYGVKLLFFQVDRFDLDPKTEEIWSPITSREDYGKDLWQDIPF